MAKEGSQNKLLIYFCFRQFNDRQPSKNIPKGYKPFKFCWVLKILALDNLVQMGSWAMLGELRKYWPVRKAEKAPIPVLSDTLYIILMHFAATCSFFSSILLFAAQLTNNSRNDKRGVSRILAHTSLG
jgi:hypothetical protein